MNYKKKQFGLRFKVGIIGTFFIISKNIYRSRSLIWQLFKRDIVTANKRSYFGFLWTFLSPIFSVLSWLIIQMAGVLKPGDIGVSFPIYVLSGTLIYNYFAVFTSSARNTLTAGASFITQVEYPHEALWGYNLAINLFWSSLSIFLNVLVLIFLGVSPNLYWFLLPILIIPMFFLGSTIGFLLLIFDKAIPDISRVFDIAIPLLYWITPVIYTISNVQNKFILMAIEWNPLYYLVVLPRDVFLFGHSSLWREFSFVSFILLFTFLISLRFYYVMEEILVERL